MALTPTRTPTAAPIPRPTLADSLTGASTPLLIGSSLMLLAGTVAVIIATSSFKSDSSLWFIGFILIALSALSMTAAVFRALGYPQSSGEAFGLPSGSIRAVLAIAIMVLLLIFGLPLVTVDDKAPIVPEAKAFATLEVECATARDEADRYVGQPVLVTLDTKGCVPPSAAVPAPKAEIMLYAAPRGLPEAQREQAKTVITALVTLLTTIIGFYFGSQNALNLVRQIRGDPVKPEDGKQKIEADGDLLPVEPEETEDPDDAEDGCCSDAETLPGEAQTADQHLPEAEGGVEPPPQPR